MSDLGRLVLETGLLQFGRFIRNGEVSPFQLSLELLPAYPGTLKQIADKAKQHLNHNPVNRLVTTMESLPLGVAVSLETGIPLVFSRGDNAPAVNDLVGAYDMGHPTVLLLNTLGNTRTMEHFVQTAKRVGLEIHTLISIFDLEISQPLRDIRIFSLLRLATLSTDLMATGQLPQGQGQAVLDWIVHKRGLVDR
jgi:hypothetical protein